MVTVTSPWRDGWRLAVGTLTVLPVRPPEQVDARVARAMTTLAPLAFMPVALIAGGLGFATVALGWPSLVAGLLTVAATAWLTRAIHLDGLADTVDGLGSGRPTEAALAIMRRGDVGPMGVVALIVVMALQAIAAAELLGREGGWLGLVVALCAGRAALALVALRGVPAARPDGLGAVFASCVPPWLAITIWLVSSAALAAAAAWAGSNWWLGVVAAAAAAAAVLALVRTAVRKLGGTTGDVLGAGVELATTALLVMLAR